MNQETTNYVDVRKRSYIKHTVHNFSSYVLSNEDYTPLLFGLDSHIPTKSKDVAIEVEFEQFYQGLLRNLTHIPENELTSLKTTLRSTCEKYSKIHVPYKYKKVTDNLSKNKNIVILKQDKGTGVVIQNVLRKIKSKFSEQEYKRLYPTGSAPARFYGTAKIHNLKK